MIRRLLLLVCLAALSASTLLGQAPNSVRSEIAVEEAWMGQDVRLTVTLLSPGPFSGTALFQIPEIPNTLIVKHGNPVVGSETIGGESMITQRHEFSVYTQQVGKVEIPAIPVDYESKETFLGDPVPRSGETTAVSFKSKRPPGTDDFAFVVSSATTKVSQSWTPGDVTEFKAGDVLSRSITREASDVSAMLFPPIQPAAIEGVRIYPSEPEVTDKRERGVATAKRVDTIKYQFQSGGTFTIPEITGAWWNPKSEALERITLEGITVTATAPPVPPKPLDKKKLAWMIGLILAGLILAKRFLFPIVRKRYLAWIERRNSPEAVAARALNRACRRNQPRESFTALMNWQRAIGSGTASSGALREPANHLSRYLFSKNVPDQRWDGTSLLLAFQEELHRRKRRQGRRLEKESLPPLNPGVL